MRIAVLNRDYCKPKECNYLCQRVCPLVRTGTETITIDEEGGRPVIIEDLCSGCGICVKKCPFNAISIINLPEEIGEPIHQFGVNGFRLYNLPTPREGVVGIVGANGIGKTTALRILSGELKPNLGGEADWDKIVERFRGHEIQNYLEKLAKGRVKAVYKPQYVDSIPNHIKGNIAEILEKGDETGNLDSLVKEIGLQNTLDKNVEELSGGELQKVALTACLIKDADIYLIDEPSSYLDVRERLNVARIIRNIRNKLILVVEHDLIILDYLSDYIHVIFGTPGVYGIISNIKSVRVGINEYLSGFLRSENIRFGDEIKFEIKQPRDKREMNVLLSYPRLEKRYDKFYLRVEEGKIFTPEVIGILGPNAIGKTTFVKLLAGVEEPENTKLDLDIDVSYKPQYIKPKDSLVRDLNIKNEFVKKFDLKNLMDKNLRDLSGGELQKVAIADCLSRDAEIYLFDEPSAYLDVEERLKLGKLIRRFAEENSKSILVVDHDILLIDYLSDELMVFSGKSGLHGSASKQLTMEEGMNLFLKEMDVTFRRDPDTNRPRANKPHSVKDREQKKSGRYYYTR